MDIEKEYQRSLDFLYSFIDLSVTRQLRYSPEKFDLTRMYTLLSLMGNPHLDYKVVHVAGTKGKGSICAMTASILQEAGYKVGFYSSPHMIDFRERIKINAINISKKVFVKIIEKYRPVFVKINNLSTFEITTAIAFKYFSDQKIDIAVIEVGMGGRLDATNVVKPIVSVISTISHDHTKILGKTLPEIAREKAGIIKNNIPVIISSQRKSVKNEISKIAEKNNARIIDVKEKYEYQQISYSLDMQTFKIIKNQRDLIFPDNAQITINLVGDHQIENAITAMEIILQLRKSGYDINQPAIKQGFYKTKWPGRFEVILKKPLVIVDGAHNLDSFRKLRDTIDKYLPNKDITCIFSVSEDKDVISMIKTIQSKVNRFIFTKTDHPRALEISELDLIAKKLVLKNYSNIKIEGIIDLVTTENNPEIVYLAAGSIFLAGALMEILSDQK